MRIATRWFGLVTMMFVLGTVPALTNPQRGGASATAKGQKTKGPSAGPKATTTSTSKGATMKPVKSTTPKGSSAVSTTKSRATTRTATRSGTTTTSPTTTTSNTTSGSTTTSAGGTGSTVNGTTWTPDNPVAQKLSTKSRILKKVQNALGADANLNNATAGFKNLGQFVAAVNVSNNLGIAFPDLKAAMTGINMDGEPVSTTGATSSGTTGVTTTSLGQAIQKLKSGVDAETVARNALTQADREINSSTTTTPGPLSASTASTSSTSTSTSTSPSTSTTTTTSASTSGTKAKPKTR